MSTWDCFVKMEGNARKPKSNPRWFGVMGTNMVRVMIEKDNLEVIGAIAQRQEKVGRDLSEVVGFDKKLGIIVSNDADAVFSKPWLT